MAANAAGARAPEAVDRAQLVQGDAVAREQAAVHDQHLAVQAVRQRQPAERLPEQVRHGRIVLRFHLRCPGTCLCAQLMMCAIRGPMHARKRKRHMPSC